MDSFPDRKISSLIEQSNRIGIEFLLNTGLTFLQIAHVTTSAAGRVRNFEKALEVYRTVERLLPRVVPAPDEQLKLQTMLGELRSRLLEAGYSCEI